MPLPSVLYLLPGGKHPIIVMLMEMGPDPGNNQTTISLHKLVEYRFYPIKKRKIPSQKF